MHAHALGPFLSRTGSPAAERRTVAVRVVHRGPAPSTHAHIVKFQAPSSQGSAKAAGPPHLAQSPRRIDPPFPSSTYTKKTGTMAAALEWITGQGLAASAGDPDQLWAVCNETLGCLRSGALRRRGRGRGRRDGEAGGPGKAARGLLAWVLDAGQDKAVPLARVAAFHLLVEGVLADCPVRCPPSPFFPISVIALFDPHGSDATVEPH